MATIKFNDESLAESDEVFFPNTYMIDVEPDYNNFTAIQNTLQYDNEQKQTNIITHYRNHSSDNQYRAIHTQIEPSSLHHSRSNQILDINTQNSFNSSTIPINIQSNKIDGHIFNLTKIVTDIGCNLDSPFLRASSNSSTKNVSALLNIVLSMGGARGPLVNVWRSHINNDYFQRWYLERYYPRSASLIQRNTLHNMNKKTTQYAQNREYKSHLVIDHLVSNEILPTKQMMNENYYQNEINKMYGYDQMNTMNTISNYSSVNGIESNNNLNFNPQSNYPSVNGIESNNNFNFNSQSNYSAVNGIESNNNLNFNAQSNYSSVNGIESNNNLNFNAQSNYPSVNGIESNNNLNFNAQSNYPSVNGMESNNNLKSNLQKSQSSSSITSILKKPNNNNNNNNNNENSQTKHRVTIREQYPTNEFNQTLSSQQINNDDQRILAEYQQIMQNRPDLHNDPNPQMITKPNPDQVTYQQNVSIRYLVPPTPPPPGPLIIREIVPPRPPTPPPVVIKYQEPSPPTPPPLILREAPPPPPPQQEPTVITKVLPPEPPSSRRVIVEHNAPLPPKPQPVIIEKWLPYKPAPPREVIYERVMGNPATAEFQATTMNTQQQRQRRHSAEFHSSSSRTQIPVNLQRRNSVEHLNTEHITQQQSGAFNELAWRAQQQLFAIQQRNREQMQAHQQWAANLWQQNSNRFLQYPTQLTTSPLVVYHPPVAMNTAAYAQRHEYHQQHRQEYHHHHHHQHQQQHVQYNPTIVYPFV
ncbi:unnamed protein product [Rotaria sordida]|uniref:Uncharacterized protein n=1 Tax=Rotaria sordida TaxID=392033 RepID=A0A815I6J1_9BILA|nr:unnamed protein product [Rotaria sordida]